MQNQATFNNFKNWLRRKNGYVVGRGRDDMRCPIHNFYAAAGVYMAVGDRSMTKTWDQIRDEGEYDSLIRDMEPWEQKVVMLVDNKYSAYHDIIASELLTFLEENRQVFRND